MPIKPINPVQEQQVDIGAMNRAVASDSLSKLQNLYLPEEIEKSCPVFTQLYNLFEKNLPGTGHFAGLVATALASMCINSDRQSNLAIGAEAGEGKTVVLSQFSKLGFVNFFNRTTYSDYVRSKCGYYVTQTGKELPLGVKVDKRAFSGVIDKSGVQDRIKNFFDIVTEGEGIFTTNDVGKLLQLWNSLIEQGWYTGGDAFNGQYIIASPQYPLKHGLIFACTISDFDRNFVFSQQIGWVSRMVLAVYKCLDVENEYVQQGLLSGRVSDIPRFENEVNHILTHLIPSNYTMKITHNEESIPMLKTLVKTLMKIRNEGPGKRATKDIIRLAHAFAWLNNSNEVKYHHILVLKSLLEQCKRIPRVINNKVIGFTNIGSRLDFQLSLRYGLNQDQDLSQTKKDIRGSFIDWDGRTVLYTDKLIDEHFQQINLEASSYTGALQ